MKRNLLSIFSFFLMQYTIAQSDVVWEKTIGGKHAEFLYNAVSTPDYGFLIIGSSSSDSTGDIQKENQGGLDYFIWKMDENGQQEWQNSFGGSDNDFLYAAQTTMDGGYILVGASTSHKSGDKTTEHQGNEDIWIIKIDAQGKLQWQQLCGGNGNDIPVDVIRTKDKGYIIVANSNSTFSPYKKSENFGGNDYYIIKLNDKGEILWEKTFGGLYEDKIKSVLETKEGFVLVGNSNSPVSGNKISDQNTNGIWIVSIDQNGNTISENNLGLINENSLISFESAKDEYIFTLKENNGNKVVTKVIKTDYNLNQLSSVELDIDNSLYTTGIKLVDNNQYLLTANKISSLQRNKSNDSSIESYYVAKYFDNKGTSIWEKKLGDKGFNYLEKAITTRDGSIILFGNSTQQSKGNNGQSDFYLVKLGNKSTSEERDYIEVYPNPTNNFTNILINKAFDKASVEIYNLTGQHLQSIQVKYRSTAISLGNYPSGIYILKINYDNQTESIKIIKK